MTLPTVCSNRCSTWASLLAAPAAVLAAALSPPLLSSTWRAAVLHVFAPVCHQIPARSPALWGVQVAICDRCVGIYVGLVFGVATVGWAHRLWREIGLRDRYVLLGSLLPAGIDWIGPILGLWGNGPLSRVLTGLVFGAVAASFVADRLLRAPEREREARASTGTGERGFA